MSSDLKIIDEKSIALIDMRKILDEIKKRDKELNFRAKKTEDYINSIVKVKDKKAEDLKADLDTLNITRLKQNHIVKIIDILPQDIDSLKMIISSDNVTLKQEDLDQILSTIKKHV